MLGCIGDIVPYTLSMLLVTYTYKCRHKWKSLSLSPLNANFVYCIPLSYVGFFAIFSHVPIGYGLSLLWRKEIDFGGAQRRLDLIGSNLEVFRVLSGLLKFGTH